MSICGSHLGILGDTRGLLCAQALAVEASDLILYARSLRISNDAHDSLRSNIPLKNDRYFLS